MLNALLLVEESGSFAFSSFPHSGFCWSYPSSNVNTFLSSSTFYKLAVGSRTLIRLWFAFWGQDCITCSVVYFHQMAPNVWRCFLWCQWPWSIILVGFWEMLGFKFCSFLIDRVESFPHQLFGYLEIQFVHILAWVSQEAKPWNVGFIGEHGPRERSEGLGRRESQSGEPVLRGVIDWVSGSFILGEKGRILTYQLLSPTGGRLDHETLTQPPFRVVYAWAPSFHGFPTLALTEKLRWEIPGEALSRCFCMKLGRDHLEVVAVTTYQVGPLVVGVLSKTDLGIIFFKEKYIMSSKL